MKKQLMAACAGIMFATALSGGGPVQAASVTLVGGATLDLDTGKTGRAADADVALAKNEEGRDVLAARNGALIALQGERRPSIAICRQAVYTTDPIRLHRLRPARYFCVRTNQGRFASVLVERGARRGAPPQIVLRSRLLRR